MRTRRQDRRDLRCSATFAVSLFALLLAGCEEKKTAAPPPPPPEVILAEVGQETVPIILQASGTVKAVKNVEIIPRVSGYIFERYFTEGTFVDKDAPLYLIDPRPFEDRLAQLTAELKGQQSTLKFWTSEEKRYASLAKQGAGSKEQAEGSRAKLDETRAQIESTKVQIRNAELDISYTKINAPFYGRVQQTQINVGNLVTKQQDVLTSIVTMDPIYVIFQLSRSQVFDVQKMKRQGLAFEVKDMEVQVVLSDGQLYKNKGRIDFISAEIDPTTDSVTVRGIFDNPNNEAAAGDFDLIPGQYVPVRVLIGNTPDALVIPQTAVIESQAGVHVYVVGTDNKVEQRKVELGRTYDTKIVVTKGLKSGEKVIAEGVQKVRAKIEVKPIEPAKPGKDETAPAQG